MNIKELKEKYGYMFNIIDYNKLKWYQKILFKIKRLWQNIIWKIERID